MQYNIFIELTSIVYVGILCIYHELQYSNKREVNRAFSRLAWTVFAASVFDVLTAVTISYADRVPIWINIFLNTLYFELDALIGFFFVRYVSTYVYDKEERKKVMRVNHFFHAIYICILILNLWIGWVFAFGDAGKYTHGFIYAIVYIMPLYYLCFSTWLLVRNWSKFHKKQKVSLVFFLVLIAIGPLLQLLFLPDVLISVFSGTIGLVILHYSIETPDYQRLMKTMDELKIAEEAAREANNAKGEFLANMSHEMRTPLNVILGFNEMIMKETKEKNIGEYSQNVQSAGRTLISIVNDIFDFINLDTGNMELDIKPYDTLSLLQDIISYSKPFAERKNLKFRLYIDEALPQSLYGDMAKLMQILNNVLSNAVKYTQEGYVDFCFEWDALDGESGNICIKVSDSGIGIREEDVEKLTELGKADKTFLRFDEHNNRNIQGIGLGLTIVIRLLEMMGSHLDIDSEYGVGSCFSFKIKQKIANDVPIGKSGNNIGKARVSTIHTELIAPDARILVVDDNSMNLDMFRGLLKHTQINIDTAEDGREALEFLCQNSYDIVFLDHMMPVMDGLETLREIIKKDLCPDTPVIVLTANAVPGAKESYLEAGFKDYLSKPVKGSELEEAIWKYLPHELTNSKEDGTKQDIQPESDVEVSESGQGFLSGLTFLDTDTGMAYCGESEEFYQEMLSSYLDNNRSNELETYYKKKDWENYRIAVHALKSTSLSIGGISVSEQAKALEMASKDGDVLFIEGHHGNLMEDYNELLSQINIVLNGKDITDTNVAVFKGEMPLIFAVDDDAMNLRSIELIMQGEYNVKCFDAGERVIDALKNELPRMILLDVRMPGMDGFEVLKRLKENEVYRQIPVIFLTADEERNTEIRGFKEGVIDFIRKPFASEIMMERVKRILELDSLQKDLQSEVEKQTHELIEQRQKVEHLTVEVIQTLAGAIDAKDKYTNGHSKRVAGYAMKIAQKIGKSKKELDDIFIIGLLHDVGKIGIPDEIINKPDKLTDEEYAVIKAHPVIGANILSNITEIPGIAIGAHWHHERYDGKGYPDGLKGEDIPEMARIIGVADAYDAMASKRSYRDVLPQEVVRDELVKGRGTQFDPLLADVMISLMDEDTEYKMREKN